MSPPKCFISYSWEGNDHKDWVRFLAEKLRENGVDVILDQWNLRLGSDLTQFMEESVRDSNFILLVCTPKYANKSNLSKGGVGYEKMIVTGEIFHGINKPEKFVPVLRKGNVKESLPTYLKPKVFVDFRNDKSFDSGLLNLLRHIHDSPLHCAPPIGAKPALAEKTEQLNADEINISEIIRAYCKRCGVKPGKQSNCPGYAQHDFVPISSGDQAYCKRCGAMAGEQTSCPGYAQHDFVPFSSKDQVYCKRCGAKSGKPSTCPGYAQHDFVFTSNFNQVYCKRCGAILGEQTNCPGYAQHDFVFT